MSKKHDAIFDDVLSGLDSPAPSSDRGGARFLKRSTSIGERMSGEMQEKTPVSGRSCPLPYVGTSQP